MNGDRLEKRKNLELELIQKAQSNEAFRNQLVNDPRAAIEAHLGETIPASFNVKTIEETPDTFFLVLPAQRGSRELTEAELDKVSGGSGCGCVD